MYQFSDGCQFKLTGNHFELSFPCVLKHMFEFHIKCSIDVVIKAPHQNLLDDNNIYRYQFPILGFEDIKFDTEFKRFRDGIFGVWIVNRWSVKINGEISSMF